MRGPSGFGRSLTDVKRWPEWAETVTSVTRLDEGPLTVNSRARVEQPRLPPTEYVVTELSPGESFTWVTTSPGVRTVARHDVEALPRGGTRVRLAVEQAGTLGKVTGRLLFKRLTQRYLASEAAGLKARSESAVWAHPRVRPGHEARGWPSADASRCGILLRRPGCHRRRVHGIRMAIPVVDPAPACVPRDHSTAGDRHAASRAGRRTPFPMWAPLVASWSLPERGLRC
jgi:hypothetical protein